MENCIFCKIAKGEIPSYKVYDDEDFMAFMDIAPASNGHILVVPKKHAANLLEMGDEDLAKAFKLAKKIAKAMTKAFGFTDFNIVQNNGPLAGQSVPHFHIHIIPRYTGNEMPLWTPHDGDKFPCAENAKKVADNI